MKTMKQDFFTYMPSEIIIEILSRLPPQTVLRCKCVCRLWHALVSTHDFAKFHLSKSVPGLALTIKPSGVMEKKIEMTNVLDIQHHNLVDLHFNTITSLYFTCATLIQGSIDGLLLLRTWECGHGELYLCNPITRECIDLLHSQTFDPSRSTTIYYGFGVSKVTGQYKVVGVFRDQILAAAKCMVYTIGTGTWRSIAPHALVRYNLSHTGAFVNGYLHWLAYDINGTLWISCFDLETELFNTFSPPPPLQNEKRDVLLAVVEGNMCLCENASSGSVVIIWLMKEYGVQKSWTKEIVIECNIPPWCGLVYPIRISKDGIILTGCCQLSLFYYSTENKTAQRICCSDRFDRYPYSASASHIPSFLSLKCFTLENFTSF